MITNKVVTVTVFNIPCRSNRELLISYDHGGVVVHGAFCIDGNVLTSNQTVIVVNGVGSQFDVTSLRKDRATVAVEITRQSQIDIAVGGNLTVIVVQSVGFQGNVATGQDLTVVVINRTTSSNGHVASLSADFTAAVVNIPCGSQR